MNGYSERAAARPRVRPILAIGLILTALSRGIYAESVPTPLLELSSADRNLFESGEALLDEVSRNAWAYRGSKEEHIRHLASAASSFERLGDPAARDYLLARVALYRGILALRFDGDRAARFHFEEAMDLAARSLDSRATADGWRVKADAGSFWMVTKGLGGIIRMAPQVQEWTDMALLADPSNPLAIVINAQGKINAPKSAGGDPEEAVRILESLVRRTDLDDIALFRGSHSLALAYRKVGRMENADTWCEYAARIFPDNPVLEDCR